MNLLRSAARSANNVLERLTGRRLSRVRIAPTQGFDRFYEGTALSAMATIERYNGCKLSPQLKALIDDYAIQVFGGKHYSPWLCVYALVSGAFKEGWIPENFYARYVVPTVNNHLRSISGVKTFSSLVLRSAALPDIAYHIDGVFYDRTRKLIAASTLLDGLAASYSHLFIKKDGSSRGEGVVKISTQGLGTELFQQIGDCVMQAPIEQHEFFDRVTPESVATLRITTVKDPGGTISIRAAYLRLGRRDSKWVQSDNSVRVSIVDDDGQLDEFGYTQDWRRWHSHPDSEFRFAEHRIPKYKEAVRTCLALHSAVPHFRIVGWDIAIGRDEQVKLIEWNTGHSDIKFSEATVGPCFKGLGWEKLRPV